MKCSSFSSGHSPMRRGSVATVAGVAGGRRGEKHTIAPAEATIEKIKIDRLITKNEYHARTGFSFLKAAPPATPATPATVGSTFPLQAPCSGRQKRAFRAPRQPAPPAPPPNAAQLARHRAKCSPPAQLADRRVARARASRLQASSQPPSGRAFDRLFPAASGLWRGLHMVPSYRQ